MIGTVPHSSLTTGNTTQATVGARDAANTVLSLIGRTVVWTSSAPRVATVSASGLGCCLVSVTAPDSRITLGDPALSGDRRGTRCRE